MVFRAIAMDSLLSSIVDFNTFILDMAVSTIIFANALVDMGRKDHEHYQIANCIVIPDSFVPSNNSSYPTDHSTLESSPEVACRRPLLRQYAFYIAWLILYFALMLVFGVASSRLEGAVLLLQHFCISIVVYMAMRTWITSRWLSLLFAITLCGVWLKSFNTSYRWMINNAIVLLIAAMTRYVKFKNFISLQIFMWVAFCYDVFALSQLPSTMTSSMFSLAAPCNSLLCDVSLYNIRHDLPTVFSVRFGPSTEHVYLGAGDIIIGAFCANFTAAFFHSRKHLAFNVCLFALAILVLMSVTTSQSPALLTIVPFATIGIIASAFSTRSVKRLIHMD